MYEILLFKLLVRKCNQEVSLEIGESLWIGYIKVCKKSIKNLKNSRPPTNGPASIFCLFNTWIYANPSHVILEYSLLTGL